MNSKVYESFFSICILFVLFILVFIFSFIYSSSASNIRKYQMVSGLVSAKNQVMIFVTSEQLNWLYRNRVVLIDGDKSEFLIDRKLKPIIMKKNKKMYQVFLSVSTKKYVVNDSILIGILQEKSSFFSIFLDTWKGG